MIHIEDNYISKKHYGELNSLWVKYNKVHWIGTKTISKNPLHKLVYKTRPRTKVSGATAWYNIRPTNPQWHDDINSYCTQDGIPYYPKRKPEFTYLYYIHKPDAGGELELETGDLLIPKVNRLIYFPCSYRHKIRPYRGNRVSIGIIWWFDLPKIYGNLNSESTQTLDRVWEKEDAKNYNK